MDTDSLVEEAVFSGWRSFALRIATFGDDSVIMMIVFGEPVLATCFSVLTWLPHYYGLA